MDARCAARELHDFYVRRVVLDHTVTLPSGARLANPMRVISNGDGSEILFTLIQHQDMSDQQFQEDAERVLSDLHTLQRLLEPAGP